jgi:hypothetical protein
VGSSVQSGIVTATPNSTPGGVVTVQVMPTLDMVSSYAGATFTAVTGYNVGSSPQLGGQEAVVFVPSFQTNLPPNGTAAIAGSSVPYLTLDASNSFTTTTDVRAAMFYVVPAVAQPSAYQTVGNRFCMTPSSVMLILVSNGRRITVTPSALDLPSARGVYLNCL